MRWLKEQARRAIRLERPASGAQVAEPALEAYERQRDGVRTRFHLRVEPDGRGLLVVDASSAVRLSPSGAVLARLLLEGRSVAEATAEAQHRFRGVPPERVAEDVGRLASLLERRAAGELPVLNLDDPAVSPHEARLAAPFEATLALTRDADAGRLLDRLWHAGIPHVVLRARDGEVDLVRAVERAEDLGMITGVAGTATDLRGRAGLAALANAGLDHVDVAFAGEAHSALLGEDDQASARELFAQALRLELCPVAEIPLVRTTVPVLPELLRELREREVAAAACWALAVSQAGDDVPEDALPAHELRQVASDVEEGAADHDLRLVWLPPVARRAERSLREQVGAGPRCAGDVAVRVEPDGGVVPARGPHIIAGNLLTDPWETIWKHGAFESWRERVHSPTRCEACPGLALCAADCPASPEGWAR